MRIYKESGEDEEENCIEYFVVRGKREERRSVKPWTLTAERSRTFVCTSPSAPVGSPASLILNPTCNYAIRHQRWKSAGSRLGAAAERLFICFTRIGRRAGEREELGVNTCLLTNPYPTPTQPVFYAPEPLPLLVSQDGQSRTIRQFQFTDWPEQGVPKTGEGFIDFIGQVHKTKEQFGQDGPITVHCR